MELAEEQEMSFCNPLFSSQKHPIVKGEIFLTNQINTGEPMRGDFLGLVLTLGYNYPNLYRHLSENEKNYFNY